jgi:hypothetical protein
MAKRKDGRARKSKYDPLLEHLAGIRLSVVAMRFSNIEAAKGDMDGRRTWLDVLRAIDELQGITPGETRH